MGSAFFMELRSALETGPMAALGSAYAGDAVLETYLPGGVRVARGPAAIVSELSRTLTASSEVVYWRPRTRTSTLEVRHGQGVTCQYHVVAESNGLVERHWVFSCAPGSHSSRGVSGARVARIERADGSVVFEKQISATRDWLMRATGDSGREAQLWHDGPLRALPAGLVYPIVSAERIGDGWLVTTADVSEHLLSAAPSLQEWRVVHDRLASLHDLHRGRAPSGLCSLRDRLLMLSARCARNEIDGCDWIPKALLHGWRELPALLPDALRGPLLALASAPAPLIGALEAAEQTMIHGDPSPGNLGVAGDDLIALDWALTTRAPAELDYVWMLGSASQFHDDAANMDQPLDDIRAALGPRYDEGRLRLALLYQFLLGAGAHASRLVTMRGGHADDDGWRWWLARASEGLAVLETKHRRARWPQRQRAAQ